MRWYAIPCVQSLDALDIHGRRTCKVRIFVATGIYKLPFSSEQRPALRIEGPTDEGVINHDGLVIKLLRCPEPGNLLVARQVSKHLRKVFLSEIVATTAKEEC